MIYLKSCPKCHGDLYLDRDHHGPFRQCLQCGFLQDIVPAQPAMARALVPAMLPNRARAAAKPLARQAVA